ncbi:MAG: Replicative DNA helicase [candidate division WS2 bacterium ADurb.Bin280]|uniref:Replicative DNA helicase n=1 Tax=candidate division WS2 bacterium ADurb.Bin280 TaxID=1852829 RepID=A0A1V5SF14_9BACT|nr:MAG: Replicative DNA helicase [candidate division WS2 bacterium ADurb.Bin280]
MVKKEDQLGKVPPQNPEAEQAVIGAVLLDKEALYKVGSLLSSEDFYRNDHREIYEAALSLFEKRSPIDLVTITDELKSRKKLEISGGATYLAHLANQVVSSAHVVKHAEIVREKAILRRLIETATTIIEKSYDQREEISSILDKSEQLLFSVSQRFVSDDFLPVKDILIDTFDRINELHENKGQLRGVPTGFRDLDNLLAGFQQSDLIILAARPSMGKTTIALNIASHVSSKEKIPVGIFSLEMSKDQLVDALLTMEAGIDSWRLRTGNLQEDDFPRLNRAMGILSEAPLFIDDSPLVSIMDIRAKARRLQAEHGLGMVIVDYLQLMESKNKSSNDFNRVQEVSEISRGLKALARELKVPVIALSQLSRAVEARHPKIPQLADLRESGCLSGDTLVFDPTTGLRYEISEIVGKKEQKCLALDHSMNLKKISSSKIFSTGKKKVYKISLASGKSIKATANHKFFTIDGWKRLDELNQSDCLATPRKIPAPAIPVDVSEDKLIVLAHLIGDGCYLKRQPLHYTNADRKCLAAVNNASINAFGTKNKLIKQENWYHLYLSAPYKLARGRRNPIAKWLDEDMHIFDQRSAQKEIPEIVFRLNDKKLALFISHLFSTDGSITKYRDKWRLYYSSKSRKLIDSLQLLLLRFEIHSIIKTVKKENYDNWFTLDICGSENQLKFLREIGIFGQKQESVLKAIEDLEKKKPNTNVDVVPSVIWTKIKEKCKIRGLSGRDFHLKMNWAYSGNSRHKNGISRERMYKIAKALDDEELMTLARSQIFWDKIVSIEELGIEDVYDITVPSLHNFVANSIIVHNSIEQDADVVMFIYREEYYDPDTEKKGITEVLVKKHRNGPIGDVELFFNPQLRRFTNMERNREQTI